MMPNEVKMSRTLRSEVSVPAGFSRRSRAERFGRTLGGQAIHGRVFEDIEAVRAAVGKFADACNAHRQSRSVPPRRSTIVRPTAR